MSEAYALLKTEAAELYPESYDAETGHHVDDWGYSECQRTAHVRAKTITEEQLEDAASDLSHTPGLSATVTLEEHGPGASIMDVYRAGARAALAAIGVHVQEETDE